MIGNGSPLTHSKRKVSKPIASRLRRPEIVGLAEAPALRLAWQPVGTDLSRRWPSAAAPPSRRSRLCRPAAPRRSSPRPRQRHSPGDI